MFIIENVAVQRMDPASISLFAAVESLLPAQLTRRDLPAIEGLFGKSKAEKLQDAMADFKAQWKIITDHKQTAAAGLVDNCNKIISRMQKDIPDMTRQLQTLTPEQLAKAKPLGHMLHYVDTFVGLAGTVELPELVHSVLSLTAESLLKNSDGLTQLIHSPPPAVKRAFDYSWDAESETLTLLPTYHYKNGPSFHQKSPAELGYTVQNLRGILADIEKAIAANKQLCAMLPSLMQRYHDFGEVCVNKIFIGSASTNHRHYVDRLTRGIAPIWENATYWSLSGYATPALTVVRDIVRTE